MTALRRFSTSVLALWAATAFTASAAAAQWLGEPMWNNPTGGGLAINADYAKPNSSYGSGTTWGARVSWGRGTITFTAGAASWTPQAGETLTSIGGDVAFRLIGGSLLPTPAPGIRANLQVGAAHTDAVNVVVSPTAVTVVTGALGFGIQLPARNLDIEPYLSPGIRYRSLSGGGSSSEFGYAIGANVGFGTLGVHLAYDHENVKGGGTAGVFGVGAQLTP